MLITPFNLAWFIFLGIAVAGLIVGAILMKNKSRDYRRIVIGIIGVIDVIAFILYRYGLFADPGYNFIIWDELPLNLCNIAVFLIPIAAFADCKWLQAYCYFGCVIGAIAGASVSLTDFKNVPVFSAKGLGFYGTHFLVLFLCLSFVVFGVYKPVFKHIFVVAPLLFASAGVIHVINVIFRATVSPTANYFYTFGIEDNPLIMAVYNVLPVPYLYLILFIPVFAVVASLLYLPVLVTRKITKKA